MNRKVLIPIVAVALLAGIAGFVTCRGAGPSDRLLVSGNIEVTQVEASFRLAGKVLERPIEEGQLIQEGQLLARLDAKDLEQTLAMRQADSKLANAALSELQAGSRKEEIETAKAILDQTTADLKRLEPDEARVRDLHIQGIVSTRDYESIRAALEAAKAKVRQAEQQYVLMQKGPRSEDLAQGQARLEQAQQALALAQTQLGYTTLTAPSSGVVLSVNVEAREYVAPGTAVATIGNLANVWLRAYVEETDLGRVKVGQKAILTTDTFPGRKYQGHVSFVASEAEFTPKSVQTKKERVKLVYRIKIDVPNPSLELKPGMPADAEILVEQEAP
jgi:HlyD family secretion protein